MSSADGSQGEQEASYEELVAVRAFLTQQNLELEQELELYRHRYEELRRKVYGRRSEQRHVLDPGQEMHPSNSVRHPVKHPKKAVHCYEERAEGSPCSAVLDQADRADLELLRKRYDYFLMSSGF